MKLAAAAPSKQSDHTVITKRLGNPSFANADEDFQKDKKFDLKGYYAYDGEKEQLSSFSGTGESLGQPEISGDFEEDWSKNSKELDKSLQGLFKVEDHGCYKPCKSHAECDQVFCSRCVDFKTEVPGFVGHSKICGPNE
ncbi:Uu.00g000390.m01.CDS01 [Anthostomella pinea]|uniref:Uu.00g000390.m01.CDS01 n=1 Tax=Anthostomella pinea TaxID=933095 RepID=A0AAI8YIE4_9PEZI|nr:Uu.00g000390.m01.CDS01 [Anthostomella pinea]